jgi:ADP-ribose pyrophosphatase
MCGLEIETMLASRSIYKGKILNLRVDRAALPGGGEAIREVVEFHGGVAILALDDAGCVMLIRQYRYAVGETLWELPAGMLEPGELPEACAERELAEETGYRAERIEPLSRFYSTPGATNEVLHVYLATGLTPGGPRPEADERIQVIPTAWEVALAMVERGEIRDGKTIIGLLTLQSRRTANL